MKSKERIEQEIEKILNQYLPIEENLIQILNEVQDKFGCIPKEIQKKISQYLNMPLAQIYGVITFYSRFTLEPKGKYTIAVCLGTACYIKGAQKILEILEERLNIEPGQTTTNGMYTLEISKCKRCCGQAPIITINEEIYEKMTVKKLDEMLDEIERKEKKNENI